MSGAEAPLVVRGMGLVLREWTEQDVPAMVRLFDTPDVDRWTPLPSPFDEDAASAYLQRANRARSEGRLQLAITVDGAEPMGEVLLLPTASAEQCELGYVVGPAYRGRNLAARAVLAMLPVASARGYREARLTIAVGNAPSIRVACAAGFTLSNEPLQREERKGYVLDMATWTREIGAGGRPQGPEVS